MTPKTMTPSVVARSEARFAYGFTFTVMAGLVPAIRSGGVPRPMAGTSPAMTVRAGFIQGGSAAAGWCGTRNDKLHD